MSASLRQVRFEAWDAYELANDLLRVIVVPLLGGKIVSLVSRQSSREWLWRNPHLSLTAPAPDARDYGAHDFGGWDEVFPTVSPCEAQGTVWADYPITDHGELWRRPWTVVDDLSDADGDVSLTLRCEMAEFGVTFTRRLTLAAGAGKLTCDYTTENRATLSAPYIWAAHPLIAIRPGDIWSLPIGTQLRLGVAVGIETSPTDGDFRWPYLPLPSGNTLDLSRVPEPTASYALKIFALGSPCMSLRGVGDERLTLTSENPHHYHFALWLNYGGWSGADCPHYFNAGFEPTNVVDDSLADATREGRAAVLSPGSVRQWRLVVEVN